LTKGRSRPKTVSKRICKKHVKIANLNFVKESNFCALHHGHK
jgi:hypothetical protein